MLKYVINRLLLMLLIIVITFVICFVLIRLLPLPEISSSLTTAQQEAIKARREALGYGKPIPEQLIIYLRSIFVRGSWGVSEYMYPNTDVLQVFYEKLPATMIVNLWSIIFSIPIGIAFGVWAALKKNTWIDHTISTLVMVVISVPSFVYAFMIQYFLCFKLGWFPQMLISGTDWFSWDMFVSMVPAIMSMSFGVIAGFTRTTRAELTEVLTSEFMLLARTKGLTKGQAVVRHGMRNIMVIILPAIFGEFIAIMSGSLIIEKIFGIPGVGALYLNSISTTDYNFFILLTVFYIVVGLLSGLVVDVSYGFIDPRIRMGSKK